MGKIKFKCLKCAHCCRNLFKDNEGITAGLALSPEETKLFPDNLVSPHTGIGWGNSGPKYIISYQLNVNVCPHLSEDNSCKIHDERPAVCRAFPLISIGWIGTSIADPADCTFVRETEKKIGSLDSILPMTPKKFKAPVEWQAISVLKPRLYRAFSEHATDAQVLWLFDLKSNEWQIKRA
jgi:Fe-S-cluster containining protein